MASDVALEACRHREAIKALLSESVEKPTPDLRIPILIEHIDV
jgi:hypothetical protein